MIVGVISDTHGLLREKALRALDGVEHILHAGDVGDLRILERLQALAPVTAIRGNIDEEGPCQTLPMIEIVELAGVTFYMLHNRQHLDLDPASAGFGVVIYGHSHKPSIERSKGVLFFNPGSAGPRRFKLPITIGTITITDGVLYPLIVELEVPR